MQNEPNFQKSQMNVNLYITTDYENKRNWTLGENEPNQSQLKPIQTQFVTALRYFYSFLLKNAKKSAFFSYLFYLILTNQPPE